MVRDVMKTHMPDGFEARRPGARAMKRQPLFAIGPGDEVSVDGHDKLNCAGFSIYGVRDVWSGKWLAARVVPSNRYVAVVGVLFLELVLELGGAYIDIV